MDDQLWKCSFGTEWKLDPSPLLWNVFTSTKIVVNILFHVGNWRQLNGFQRTDNICWVVRMQQGAGAAGPSSVSGEFSLGMLWSTGSLSPLANIKLPDDWLVAPTEAPNQTTQSSAGIIQCTHESWQCLEWGACHFSNRKHIMAWLSKCLSTKSCILVYFFGTYCIAVEKSPIYTTKEKWWWCGEISQLTMIWLR